ncbi:hypothetical protein EC60172_3656B, partial [Escherichia coli 6.0172]
VVYDTPVVIFSIWYIPRLPQSGSSQHEKGQQLFTDGPDSPLQHHDRFGLRFSRIGDR